MAKKQQQSVAGYAEMEGSNILDDIIATGIKPKKGAGQDRAQELVRNLVGQIIEVEKEKGTFTSPGISKLITQRIAAIDAVISAQLSEVMHHADFRALEGSWRGLHKFVMDTETSKTLKIRLLNVSRKELLDDFRSAVDFTESGLWKKIYTNEYGTFGGDPYGALVGDYAFGKGPEDIELLEQLSGVAASAHAPFITSPSPDAFGMDSFTEIPDPVDLAKKFDKSNPENAKWLSFRDAEDSRYVCMAMPRVLSRLPYGNKTRAVDAFNFEEDVGNADHDKFCWSSAAYAFAANVTRAFAEHSWCTAIRGPEGGGLVEGLPLYTFQSEEGDIGAKCPTEVMIPEDREYELAKLGFTALCHCKNTDYGAFFGGNAVQEPKVYDDPDATANADLSRKIPYLLATSRMAHYLKVMCRDKIGSFMTRQDCEDYLNRWIKGLVLNQDDATQDQKAKYPLREAGIEVLDDKSRPGCYRAVAYLKPHFQLEELNVSLRLVADLPDSVK
jgi:type VI secretion system protein ImpC